MKLKEVIDLYLLDLEERQLSDATIRIYGWVLTRFAAYTGPETAVSEITRLDLARFIRSAKKESGDDYSPVSRGTFAAHLRPFFGWCRREGYHSEHVGDRLRRAAPTSAKGRMANGEHLERVLISIPAYITTGGLFRLRDAAVVSLSADSGGRLGEIHNLSYTAVSAALLDPIVTASGALSYHVISYGKTGEALLRFYEGTASLMRQYIAMRPHVKTDKLFLNHETNSPASKAAITCAFDRLCKYAGVPVFRSHAVRHRNITDMMRGGTDPKVASKYANHRNVSTTITVYRHVLDDEVDEAMRAIIDARNRNGDEIKKLFGGG